MFRTIRNSVFYSEAPPVFAAASLLLFIASMVAFWLWMSFASHLPVSPCKPPDTVVHFRSYALCATSAQAAHWAREDFTWKALFAGSFVVLWSGIAYAGHPFQKANGRNGSKADVRRVAGLGGKLPLAPSRWTAIVRCMSPEELDHIADRWVEEFSVEPYVVRRREMDAWFKLDNLVHNNPLSAIVVFEKVAAKDLINWTFEGFAAGPVRTFLMLYGDRYDVELAALRRRSPAFEEMWAMAIEGL